MRFQKHVIGLAVGALFAVTAGAAAAQTVVKIGHVAPLTGAIAHLGKDNELGARMAIEELNAKGMKLDGKAVKFELMSEDDGADPKQGTAAAQKLVDAEVAGVIGHLNSGTTIPASRIYSDAGIPQISPSATNPKYTQQGFKTAFRVVANDGQLGGTLGRYAVKELKAKAIAIIDDRTAYGQGVADEFRKAAVAAGGKVVGRENVKFMGGDGICSPKLAELAGGAMSDGQVVCAEAGGITPDKEPGMKAWREAFKKKFGVDVQIYAPYVYDATMTMAHAMQKANSADPKKYLPELAKITHDGVTGKISFDNKGDIKGGNLTLFTYKDGKRDQIAVVQ